MNISKEEAQESLAEIENTISRTRNAKGHFTGYILMIWGIIWAVGFSAVQFFPHSANWVWIMLDVVGFTGTGICVRRSKLKFGHPNGGRIGLAWLFLFGYMILWGFLLHLNGRESIAFFSTVCMCAYVMMGLWLSRFCSGWVWS